MNYFLKLKIKVNEKCTCLAKIWSNVKYLIYKKTNRIVFKEFEKHRRNYALDKYVGIMRNMNQSSILGAITHETFITYSCNYDL